VNRFGFVGCLHDIGQALPFGVSNRGFEGWKLKFNLDQRIRAAGVSHERLNERR
jgi:hypothetical protein